VTEQPDNTQTPIVDRAGSVVADVACVQCGYNLRGMLVEGPCPGCGLRVSHVVDETFDHERRLRAEIACLKCGYNLRSLSIDGRCPECGLPVAESVRGDLLQFASPRWVRRLALGATLLLIADICGLVAIVSDICLWLAIGLTSPPGGGLADPAVTCLLTTFAIGSTGAALAALAGILLITAPEARLSVKPRGVHVRQLCRYSLSVSVLFVLFAFLWPMATGSPARWGSHVMLFAATFLGLGVLPLSTLRHLRNLLRRVPDPATDRTAARMTVGIWVADIILVAPLVAALVGSSTLPLMPCACPSVLIAAVCGTVAVGVLDRARTSFRKAAEQATARTAPGSL
jgi:Zn finger protein HypA/HybF involved in hydrogenase expression